MMKKLTAERCKKQIEEWQRMMRVSDVAVMVELNLQAYVIALPVLERQERGKSEWIEWKGDSFSPVPYGESVEVKNLKGTAKGYAGGFRWRSVGNDFDIIAYRVVEEERERGEEE